MPRYRRIMQVRRRRKKCPKGVNAEPKHLVARISQGVDGFDPSAPAAHLPAQPSHQADLFSGALPCSASFLSLFVSPRCRPSRSSASSCRLLGGAHEGLVNSSTQLLHRSECPTASNHDFENALLKIWRSRSRGSTGRCRLSSSSLSYADVYPPSCTDGRHLDIHTRASCNSFCSQRVVLCAERGEQQRQLARTLHPHTATTLVRGESDSPRAQV